MRKNELNRKMYQRIRKMDHSQMSEFMENLYKEGYAAGAKATEGLTETEIRDALAGIKGIGEKKIDDIIGAMNLALKEKGKLE